MFHDLYGYTYFLPGYPDLYFQIKARNAYDADTIGPLQFTITWYENRHDGEQTTHWDIQNKAT